MKKLYIIVKNVRDIENAMEKRYSRAFDVHGQKCFKVNYNEFFMVTSLLWANAIVIEHAFSESEAKKGVFEDGDLFYIDELDEKQMMKQMMEEIET